MKSVFCNIADNANIHGRLILPHKEERLQVLYLKAFFFFHGNFFTAPVQPSPGLCTCCKVRKCV